MSAKDIIHESVKKALIKDGWIITHNPYTLEYETEHLIIVDINKAEEVKWLD